MRTELKAVGLYGVYVFSRLLCNLTLVFIIGMLARSGRLWWLSVLLYAVAYTVFEEVTQDV